MPIDVLWFRISQRAEDGGQTLGRIVDGKIMVMLNRVEELRDWDDIRLLTVVVDRLRTWYRPGLLCIGDAGSCIRLNAEPQFGDHKTKRWGG